MFATYEMYFAIPIDNDWLSIIFHFSHSKTQFLKNLNE